MLMMKTDQTGSMPNLDVLSCTGLYTVNLEIFRRVLFLRMQFRENKPLAKSLCRLVV